MYKFAKDCLKKVDNTRYTLDDRYKKQNETENLVTKFCKKVQSFFNSIKPKNKETGERLWKAIKSKVTKKDTSNVDGPNTNSDDENPKKQAPRTDKYTMKLEHRIAKLEDVITRMRNALEMEKDTSNVDGSNKNDEQKHNSEEETVEKGSDSQRRRLLSKVGEESYDKLWVQFTADIQGGQNVEICRNGKNILGSVIVHRDGRFEFSCSNSPELCNCISAVGSGEKITTEQKFSNGPLSLILFQHEGHAAYEIKESGEALTYGYVNDGRADRRRRRLMQGGTGRTC
jgi:hypothetical protein